MNSGIDLNESEVDSSPVEPPGKDAAQSKHGAKDGEPRAETYLR